VHVDVFPFETSAIADAANSLDWIANPPQSKICLGIHAPGFARCIKHGGSL
jgi:hypothetical protein